jgi:hypothetical protein
MAMTWLDIYRLTREQIYRPNVDERNLYYQNLVEIVTNSDTEIHELTRGVDYIVSYNVEKTP